VPIDKWTLVELRPAVDPRDKTAHRFVRGTSKIDLVTSQSDEEADDRPEEVVDVLISDHHALEILTEDDWPGLMRIRIDQAAMRAPWAEPDQAAD